jgi:hypothetical protein
MMQVKSSDMMAGMEIVLAEKLRPFEAQFYLLHL